MEPLVLAPAAESTVEVFADVRDRHPRKILLIAALYGFKERRDHRFAGALAGIRR